MAVTAIGPNKEMLQFDWFISNRIFSILSDQEGNLKNPGLFPLKIQVYDNIPGENVLQTVRKGKVTMQSKVGEEILYEMTIQLNDENQMKIKKFLRIFCWALIFIIRIRFPPGSSITTIELQVFI